MFFCEFYQIFKNTFFHKTHLGDCFCSFHKTCRFSKNRNQQQNKWFSCEIIEACIRRCFRTCTDINLCWSLFCTYQSKTFLLIFIFFTFTILKEETCRCIVFFSAMSCRNKLLYWRNKNKNIDRFIKISQNVVNFKVITFCLAQVNSIITVCF